MFDQQKYFTLYFIVCHTSLYLLVCVCLAASTAFCDCSRYSTRPSSFSRPLRDHNMFIPGPHIINPALLLATVMHERTPWWRAQFLVVDVVVVVVVVAKMGTTMSCKSFNVRFVKLSDPTVVSVCKPSFDSIISTSSRSKYSIKAIGHSVV